MAVEHGHVQLCGHINVTPLIDVLLVMLIVFMVITPTMSHGLDAALPQRSVIPNPSPDTPLVVQVTSDRDRRLSYKINQENVGIHDLGSRLSVIFRFGRTRQCALRQTTILISQRLYGSWTSEREQGPNTLD